MTHFDVVAFAGMIESWLLGEIDRTPEELIAFADTVLQEQILGARLHLGGGNQKTVAQVRPDGASGRIFLRKSGFCA